MDENFSEPESKLPKAYQLSRGQFSFMVLIAAVSAVAMLVLGFVVGRQAGQALEENRLVVLRANEPFENEGFPVAQETVSSEPFFLEEWEAIPEDTPFPTRPASVAKKALPELPTLDKAAEKTLEPPRSSASKEEAAEKPGTFVVQVLSTKDAKDARRWVDRLKKRGWKVYTVQKELAPKDIRHRVRAGPFATREEAGEMAKIVRKDYRLNPLILQVP